LRQQSGEFLMMDQRLDGLDEPLEFRSIYLALVGEVLVDFDPELEARQVRGFIHPALDHFLRRQPVKCGVHLDEIEISRQEVQVIEIRRFFFRIYGTVPVGVAPSGGTV